MKKFKLFVLISLVISALCIFCSCEKVKLATPMNLRIDIEDQLLWSEVENARAYTVEIENEDGVIKKLHPKKASVSLFELSEGDYEIRIKAENDGIGYENSNWSKTIPFKKQYETGCVYELINNNTEYAITKFGKAGSTIYIQDVYRNKPVTEIADKAFKDYKKIEHVYVNGNNLKRVGKSAFQGCINLKTVALPDSVTSIGSSAFQSCVSLEEINIPNSLSIIENSTFAYCRALKEINLHDNITAIGEYAFSDCSTLIKVVIPDSVKTMGAAVFTGATELKEVTIGKGLTAIQKNAFNMCTALETVNFAEDSSLVSIGENAFRENRKLNNVIIPEGVETIGNMAFYIVGEKVTNDEGDVIETIFDSALVNVSLPSTLTRVGAYAFDGTKFYQDTLKTEELVYLSNWLIGCSADYKANLTKLDPTQLQAETVGLGDMVFQGAPLLETVELPKSVKYIGQWSFAYSSKLETVSFPGAVLIDDYAFQGCEQLWDLPSFYEENYEDSSLEKIGVRAFFECKGLNAENLYIPTTIKLIETEAFMGTLNSYNPSSGVQIYYAGDWVVGYSGKPVNVELKPGTIGIADFAFYQCASLSTITGLSSVKYVGRSAFYGCTSLSTVFFGNKLETIEEYAFYACTSLYTVEFSRTLTSIGRSAFSNCNQLYLADFEMTNLETLGDYAFYRCSNLQNVYFNDSIKSIGKYAFYKCALLSQIILPESLTAIEDRTFYKCEKLASVTIGNNIESIGEYAFTGCILLERIKFPTKLQTIENYAFFGCEELRYITFNENLQSIGDYAFYANGKIATLQFPAALKNIGKYAFSKCNQIRSIILPSTVETIAQHAFYGCENLTLYTDATFGVAGWDQYLNSSYKAIVFGCTLSEDKTYVKSVAVEDGTLLYTKTATYGAPESASGIFKGWSLSENGEIAFTAEEIVNVPVGTTIYAIWSDSID